VRRPYDIAFKPSNPFGRNASEIRGRMKRRSPGRAIAVSIWPLRRDPSRRRTFIPIRRSTHPLRIYDCGLLIEEIAGPFLHSAIRNLKSAMATSLPIVPHGQSFVGGMIGRDATATRVCVYRRPTTLFAADRRTARALATCSRGASLALAASAARRCSGVGELHFSPPPIASPASDFLVRRRDRQFRDSASTGPSHVHPVRGCTEGAGHSPCGDLSLRQVSQKRLPLNFPVE